MTPRVPGPCRGRSGVACGWCRGRAAVLSARGQASVEVLAPVPFGVAVEAARTRGRASRGVIPPCAGRGWGIRLRSRVQRLVRLEGVDPVPSGSGPNAFMRPPRGLAGRTRMLTGLGMDEAVAAVEAALDPTDEDLIGDI